MLRVLLAVVLALAGCATTLRHFARRAPMMRDDDMRPWGPMPAARRVTPVREAADHLILGPIRDALWVRGDRDEAIDVNALDEVPDSSWYTNREPTPAEAARGACDEPLDLAGPWTVVGMPPRGIEIETTGGARLLLETDDRDRPELATAAEAIASRLYHAAGFRVSCTRVVYFAPSILRLGRRPRAPVDAVLRRAARGPGGTVRASLRELSPAVPLGPFSFSGTRGDDPNDVVPHEDRRELRASALLATWTNHFDCGARATLDVWRATGTGVGYV